MDMSLILPSIYYNQHEVITTKLQVQSNTSFWNLKTGADKLD